MAQIKNDLNLSSNSKDKNIGLEGIKKRNDYNNKINNAIIQHLKLTKRTKIYTDFIKDKKNKEIQIEQKNKIEKKKQTLTEKKIYLKKVSKQILLYGSPSGWPDDDTKNEFLLRQKNLTILNEIKNTSSKEELKVEFDKKFSYENTKNFFYETSKTFFSNNMVKNLVWTGSIIGGVYIAYSLSTATFTLSWLKFILSHIISPDGMLLDGSGRAIGQNFESLFNKEAEKLLNEYINKNGIQIAFKLYGLVNQIYEDYKDGGIKYAGKEALRQSVTIAVELGGGFIMAENSKYIKALISKWGEINAISEKPITGILQYFDTISDNVFGIVPSQTLTINDKNPLFYKFGKTVTEYTSYNYTKFQGGLYTSIDYVGNIIYNDKNKYFTSFIDSVYNLNKNYTLPYASHITKNALYSSINSSMTSGVNSMWPKPQLKVEKEKRNEFLKKQKEEKEKFLRKLRINNGAETIGDKLFDTYENLLDKLDNLKKSKNSSTKMIGYVSILLVSTFITDVIIFDSIDFAGHGLCYIPDMVLQKFFGSENSFFLNIFKSTIHQRTKDVLDKSGNKIEIIGKNGNPTILQETVKNGFLMNYIKTQYVYPKINEMITDLLPLKDIYEKIIYDYVGFSREQANDYANMSLYQKIRHINITNISLFLMGHAINTVNRDIVFNSITAAEFTSNKVTDLYNNSNLTETFGNYYNSLSTIKEDCKTAEECFDKVIRPTTEQGFTRLIEVLFLPNEDQLKKRNDAIVEELKQINDELSGEGTLTNSKKNILVIRKNQLEKEHLSNESNLKDIEYSNKLKEENRKLRENIKDLSKLSKEEYDKYIKQNREKLDNIKDELEKLEIHDPDLRKERFRTIRNLNSYLKNTPENIYKYATILGFPPSTPGGPSNEPLSSNQSQDQDILPTFKDRVEANTQIRLDILDSIKHSYEKNKAGSFIDSGIKLENFDNMNIDNMAYIERMIRTSNSHEQLRNHLSSQSEINNENSELLQLINTNENLSEEDRKLFYSVRDDIKKSFEELKKELDINIDTNKIEQLIRGKKISNDEATKFLYKHADDMQKHRKMQDIRENYFKLYGDVLSKLQKKTDVTKYIKDLNEQYYSQLDKSDQDIFDEFKKNIDDTQTEYNRIVDDTGSTTSTTSSFSRSRTLDAYFKEYNSGNFVLFLPDVKKISNDVKQSFDNYKSDIDKKNSQLFEEIEDLLSGNEQQTGENKPQPPPPPPQENEQQTGENQPQPPPPPPQENEKKYQDLKDKQKKIDSLKRDIEEGLKRDNLDEKQQIDLRTKMNELKDVREEMSKILSEQDEITTTLYDKLTFLENRIKSNPSINDEDKAKIGALKQKYNQNTQELDNIKGQFDESSDNIEKLIEEGNKKVENELAKQIAISKSKINASGKKLEQKQTEIKKKQQELKDKETKKEKLFEKYQDTEISESKRSRIGRKRIKLNKEIKKLEEKLESLQEEETEISQTIKSQFDELTKINEKSSENYIGESENEINRNANNVIEKRENDKNEIEELRKSLKDELSFQYDKTSTINLNKDGYGFEDIDVSEQRKKLYELQEKLKNPDLSIDDLHTIKGDISKISQEIDEANNKLDTSIKTLIDTNAQYRELVNAESKGISEAEKQKIRESNPGITDIQIALRSIRIKNLKVFNMGLSTKQMQSLNQKLREKLGLGKTFDLGQRLRNEHQLDLDQELDLDQKMELDQAILEIHEEFLEEIEDKTLRDIVSTNTLDMSFTPVGTSLVQNSLEQIYSYTDPVIEGYQDNKRKTLDLLYDMVEVYTPSVKSMKELLLKANQVKEYVDPLIKQAEKFASYSNDVNGNKLESMLNSYNKLDITDRISGALGTQPSVNYEKLAIDRKAEMGQKIGIKDELYKHYLDDKDLKGGNPVYDFIKGKTLGIKNLASDKDFHDKGKRLTDGMSEIIDTITNGDPEKLTPERIKDVVSYYFYESIQESSSTHAAASAGVVASGVGIIPGMIGTATSATVGLGATMMKPSADWDTKKAKEQVTAIEKEIPELFHDFVVKPEKDTFDSITKGLNSGTEEEKLSFSRYLYGNTRGAIAYHLNNKLKGSMRKNQLDPEFKIQPHGMTRIEPMQTFTQSELMDNTFLSSQIPYEQKKLLSDPLIGLTIPYFKKLTELDEKYREKGKIEDDDLKFDKNSYLVMGRQLNVLKTHATQGEGILIFQDQFDLKNYKFTENDKREYMPFVLPSFYDFSDAITYNIKNLYSFKDIPFDSPNDGESSLNKELKKHFEEMQKSSSTSTPTEEE